jgi:hypothetical protein
METLDLDIDNYDLNDLLSLFQLDYNFDGAGLKQAKNIVMQTHPDKSGLDKSYFLFFSSAYKIIHSIYLFRNKGTNKTTEYAQLLSLDEEDDSGKNANVFIENFKKDTNFNKVFNELFEKYRLEDEDMREGYAAFMRSDEGMDERKTTMATMNETFENKKMELKAIVPQREVSEMTASDGFGTTLTNEKPESYASGLFSSLQYEDLRKAHIETVIPVNHADYLQRPKYKNVDEFRRDPNYNNVNPPSLNQSKEYLQQRELLQDKTDVSRAYKLARKEEMAQKANQGFLNEFQRIAHF